MNNLEIDTVMFINEVQKRPIIWNPANPDYGKPNCRQMCWDEITNLFFDGDEHKDNEKYTYCLMLQKRWKNLRGCFTRELLRLKAPGKDSLQNPDRKKRKNHYMYYQNLLFLRDVVTSKSDAYAYRQEYPDDTLSFVKIEYEPPSNLDPSAQSTYESDDEVLVPPKKRKQMSQEINEGNFGECETTLRVPKNKKVKNEEAASTSTTIGIEEKDFDSERLFLLSLVNPLKMVPQEKRLATQMEILNVINKAINK